MRNYIVFLSVIRFFFEVMYDDDVIIVIVKILSIATDSLRSYPSQVKVCLKNVV